MHTSKHGYQYVTSRESRLWLVVFQNRLRLITQSIVKLWSLMVQHGKVLERRVCWCGCWMDCGRWSGTSLIGFCLVLVQSFIVLYTITQCCGISRTTQHFFDAMGRAQGLGHSTLHHNSYPCRGGCCRTPKQLQADIEVDHLSFAPTN